MTKKVKKTFTVEAKNPGGSVFKVGMDDEDLTGDWSVNCEVRLSDTEGLDIKSGDLFKVTIEPLGKNTGRATFHNRDSVLITGGAYEGRKGMVLAIFGHSTSEGLQHIVQLEPRGLEHIFGSSRKIISELHMEDITERDRK